MAAICTVFYFEKTIVRKMYIFRTRFNGKSVELLYMSIWCGWVFLYHLVRQVCQRLVTCKFWSETLFHSICYENDRSCLTDW